jgi:hypothetical protein
MSQIFISYRRGDTLFKADRIAERLGQQFTVFRDLDAISPGDDWERWIETELASCAVLLVLIGPRWVEALRDSPSGGKSIGITDWVALEVAAGLRRQEVTVVPVLLDDALMPADAALSPPLAPLAKRQAFRITETTWKADVERLVDLVAPLVASRRLSPTPPDEGGTGELRVSATQRTYFAPRLDFSVLVSSIGDLYRSRGWDTAVVIKEGDAVLIKARPGKNRIARALPHAVEEAEAATAVSLEFRNDYLVAVFGRTWWVNESHVMKKSLAQAGILFGVLGAAAAIPSSRRFIMGLQKKHPKVTGEAAIGVAVGAASVYGQLRRARVDREATKIIENLIRMAGGVVVPPNQ